MFLIFAVTSFVIIDINSQELRKSVELRNTSLADSMILDIDQYIKNRIDDFKTITTVEEVRSSIVKSNDMFRNISDIEEFLDSKEQTTDSEFRFLTEVNLEDASEELAELIIFYEESFGHNIIDELFITNEYGASIALGTGTSDYRQDDEEWWQLTKRDGMYIGKLEYNDNYEEFSIPFGMRIVDDEGNFVGVMRVALSLDDILSDLVDDHEILQQTGTRSVFLVDESGKILYPGTEQDSSIQKTIEYFPQISKNRDTFEIKNNLGEPILVSYSTSIGFEDFRGFGWTIIIEQAEHQLLDDFSEIRETVIIASVIGLISALIISILISRSITNPLSYLVDVARNIAQGNFDVKLQKHQISEIKTIEKSFEKMSVDLKNLVETEKELAETRAKVKNERFAAMGELSANVAHDLKNPLASIKSATNIIKQNSNNMDPKLKELVFPKMDRAISRITHQIDEVLNYVRITPINLIEVSIQKIITSSFESLSIPNNVEIVKPDIDFTVKCDVEKLEIVFINLILNAIQAFEEKQGRIKINLIDDKKQKTIEFENDGPAIPGDILQDIFKPLFTTKQKGTGLGLAISKNVIEQHGWQITVKNNPVTFSIIVPKHIQNS